MSLPYTSPYLTTDITTKISKSQEKRAKGSISHSMLSQKTSGTHERETGKGMSNPAGTRQEHPWRALHQKFMAQSRPERSQESSRPLIHISRLQNWTAELLQGLGGWSPAEGTKHNQGLAFWKTSFTINLEEKKAGTVQLQDEVDEKGKWVKLFVYFSVFPLQGEGHGTLEDKQQNWYWTLSSEVSNLLGNKTWKNPFTRALQFISIHLN